MHAFEVLDIGIHLVRAIKGLSGALITGEILWFMAFYRIRAPPGSTAVLATKESIRTPFI